MSEMSWARQVHAFGLLCPCHSGLGNFAALGSFFRPLLKVIIIINVN